MKTRYSDSSLRPILPSVILLLLLSHTGYSQIPGGISETTRTELRGRNSISGTVAGPSGRPLNYRVRLRLSAPGAEVLTSTDDSGRFMLSGLGNGTYTLYADPDGDLEPESQQIDISAPRNTSPQVYMVSFRLREKQKKEQKTGVINADLAGVPKRAVQLYRKGVESSAAGDTKSAVDQLLKAVADHPDFFFAHSELGVQYQKLNELEKADEHLKIALRLKPEAFEPLANRGIVLVRMRKYGDAEPVLRSAIKLKDGSAVAHYYLGRSLLGLTRYEEAESEFKTAYALGGKENIEARRALATIYLEKGDNQKALIELEAYLEANPTAADEKQLHETAARIREWLKENAKP